MEDSKLIAKKRDLQGSANVRRLRGKGILPGVIYADGKEATAIELNAHNFEQLLHHHSSETVLIELEVEGEGTISALVKEVQHHPVSGDLLHVDLQRMDAKKAIQVEIDVNPVGEAEGVKLGGSLDLVMHTISVECLPGDLVDSLDVDVSALDIGSSLQVSDLKIDSKYKLIGDPEAIVITISGPRAEEEEEADEDAATEPEVINEKKAED